MELARVLPEFVYGSVDGLITTFSIVAGASGGNLSNLVVLVMGLSNVFSDGFSMASASYLSARARNALPGGDLNGNTRGTGRGSTTLSPEATAIATFVAFVVVGMVPMLPFLLGMRRDAAR